MTHRESTRNRYRVPTLFQGVDLQVESWVLLSWDPQVLLISYFKCLILYSDYEFCPYLSVMGCEHSPTAAAAAMATSYDLAGAS
jgi:hypothetical protein